MIGSLGYGIVYLNGEFLIKYPTEVGQVGIEQRNKKGEQVEVNTPYTGIWIPKNLLRRKAFRGSKHPSSQGIWKILDV